MAVSTAGTFFDLDASGNEEFPCKPLRSSALKEINAVASFFGNHFFRGRQQLTKCGSLGIGVIDFADMEEECRENEIPSHKNEAVRFTKTFRSPRSVLQKKVPVNSSQRLQMDLILLDECPSREDLRKCAWKGCGPQNRAQVWRMLLGHEPLKFSARRPALEVKRKRYREYVDLLYPENDLPDTDKTIRQVEMDLPRTHPHIPIFHVPEVREPMKRILYLYGILNPKRTYVQGMNEILTPVIVVFLSSYLKEVGEKGVESFLNRGGIGKSLTDEELRHAEADAFWTFSLLVSSIKDNFTAEQSGILRRVQRLETIVREVDPLLAAHLERNGNEYIQFACRWMNCLLMRELPFPLVVKLWDALLGEEDGMADLHVYFCAALMIRFRAELLSKGFEDCIMFLQHLPTQGWKTREVDFLLSQAFVWKEDLKLESLFACQVYCKLHIDHSCLSWDICAVNYRQSPCSVLFLNTFRIAPSRQQPRSSAPAPFFHSRPCPIERIPAIKSPRLQIHPRVMIASSAARIAARQLARPVSRSLHSTTSARGAHGNDYEYLHAKYMYNLRNKPASKLKAGSLISTYFSRLRLNMQKLGVSSHFQRLRHTKFCQPC
ncbi:unnamed protein product [Chondrus crispus]|uniref:Rab-GAP TBC domain-containing protein n=1 Tax=Chondrus crispus TaxID=2769 RepID=R7Q6X2_CHOCR|nr:unnamed protein product [Chondrus crispus]CDF33784.1 unnamed protein product [Chondrus crispus]|eukprot:XP_005713603.1 unnamed protein product [Chondrus crispus]